MISNRTRRHYTAQESLKQFSLNNSKGVDTTKPITDVDTVCEMKNLKVNSDGSLSIRDRMLPAYASGVNVIDSWVMYNPSYRLKIKPSAYGDTEHIYFEVSKTLDTASNSKCSVKFTDYYTYESEVVGPRNPYNFVKFKSEAPSVFNTSDATIVGNCYVDIEILNDYGAVDRTLYDDDVMWVPRYLKITVDDATDNYTIEIINPELNQLTEAEGEIPLNPNLTLDNPYAIRDSYGNAIPSITGVLAYEYCVEDSNIYSSTKDSHSDTIYGFNIAEYSELFENDAPTDLGHRVLIKSNTSPLTNLEIGTHRIPITIDVEDGVVYATCKNLPAQCTLSVKLDVLNYDNSLIIPDYFREFLPLEYFQRIAYSAGGTEFYDSNATVDFTDGALRAPIYIGKGTPFTEYGMYELILDNVRYSVLLTLDISRITNALSSFPEPGRIPKMALIFNETSAYHLYYVRDVYSGELRFYTYTWNGAHRWAYTVLDFGLRYEYEEHEGSGELVGHLNMYNIGDAKLGTFVRRLAEDVSFESKVQLLDAGVFKEERPGASWYTAYVASVGKCTLSTTYYPYSEAFEETQVSSVSEGCRTLLPQFRPLSALAKDADMSNIILKAFCKMPRGVNEYYATWDYSFDSTVWNPYGALNLFEFKNAVEIATPNEQYVKDSPKDIPEYVTRKYVPIACDSAADKLVDPSNNTSRIDVLPFKAILDVVPTDVLNSGACTVRFSIVTVERANKLRVNVVVDSQVFNVPVGTHTEYLATDVSNAVLGSKVYYNKSVYSFGITYDATVLVSDTGSFITPMYNAIELSTNASEPTTAVVPWRNYIVTTTPTTMHLTTKTADGFYNKVASTSVGASVQDAKTLVAALSGLIFKSGPRVYFAYPNTYASDDSFLNIVDISKPIHGILEELPDAYSNFATVVDDTYVLMIPDASDTHCLRYDLNERRWEYFTYPVKFEKFINVPNAPPLVHAADLDYVIFENDYAKYPDFKDRTLFEEHRDALGYDGTKLDEQPFTLSSIPFTWDTGQKTDSIVNSKQFVESKLIFATLSEYDTFPFTLYVAIDGDPHVTTMDVTTDAPFWKTSAQDKGVTGTSIRLGGANTPVTSAFNTLRQLVVRYSGKGKSIRHLIEGNSLHNFKLYETYVRYKNFK